MRYELSAFSTSVAFANSGCCAFSPATPSASIIRISVSVRIVFLSMSWSPSFLTCLWILIACLFCLAYFFFPVQSQCFGPNSCHDYSLIVELLDVKGQHLFLLAERMR